MLAPWCEGVFACFLLHTPKFWSEELNYSRSSASFWFAIVSISSLSLNETPGSEISQVLMRFMTWWWRLLVSVAFCLRHAFFFFLFGRQSALPRGCTWYITTPLSLLWLLFPSSRAKEPTGRWVTSIAI